MPHDDTKDGAVVSLRYLGELDMAIDHISRVFLVRARPEPIKRVSE